ncbi:tol-pal system protein YbgF [Pelistega sp. NLN82]|uniref:Cell division coordinator CpoB n=1 Tax=Pelistega ratti TaxID=2652177 RepID=A0A6L9Y706_9BURK|nr:tol-pal system protein YbgF [Pelistega ratti]NEN76143.1 tol-pal system protein YbgF [Pelistega ratti]
MTITQKTIAVMLATAFISLSSPALASEDEQARRAILELRAQLKQSDMVRNDLAAQVQHLQNELRQLRGQVETLNGASQTKALEARANDDIGPSAQVGDPNEQNAFDSALDHFRQGDYGNAAKSLASFSKNYPNSSLRPTALFYEGSSRYANRDFKGAISTLNNMISTYPKDAQAGDALLVVAGSQLELNNIAASKATLQRTINEYAGTPAADTAKERLKMY